MMGRLSLAALALLVLALPAHAQVCPTEPLVVDTHDLGARGQLRFFSADESPLPELKPGDEGTPPAAPVIESVSLRADTKAYTQWFDLHATYSADTAFVIVILKQNYERAYYVTTPDHVRECSNNLALDAVPPVEVSVIAVDHHGNRSTPTTTYVPFVVGAYYPHHFRCGMGDMALLIVTPFVLLFELVMLFIVSGIRRWRIRNTPGEHVSIPRAESAARIATRAYGIKFLLALISTAALWQIDHYISAILLSPLVLVWFLDVLRAASLVRRFEQPVNRLERRDDWLLVDHTLVYCGWWAWKRASRVPNASAALRSRD